MKNFNDQAEYIAKENRNYKITDASKDERIFKLENELKFVISESVRKTETILALRLELCELKNGK